MSLKQSTITRARETNIWLTKKDSKQSSEMNVKDDDNKNISKMLIEIFFAANKKKQGTF